MALDHATLQAVLDKQGMPNTTENLNRIAQFAAVAPDMLDKYLGKGTDASRVGGTDAAIDRSIASTADPRLANLAGPNPYTATIDPATGMSNIGPGLIKGGGERQGVVQVGQPQKTTPLVPQGPGRSRATDEPPEVTPQTSGITHESEMKYGGPGLDTKAGQPVGGDDSNWANTIIPSILTAIGIQKARTVGVPTPPVTPTPNVSAATPGGAPAPARPPMAPGPGQTPADVARLQAEVDAERAAGIRIQEQLKEQAIQRGRGGGVKTPAQLNAEATANAARRATGRK